MIRQVAAAVAVMVLAVVALAVLLTECACIGALGTGLLVAGFAATLGLCWVFTRKGGGW